MTSNYPETAASPDFPTLEQDVLSDWQARNVFEQSVAQRAPSSADGSNNEYVFYDGPPFANGLPHHGHLLTGFVKDLFARYHTMKGQRVERRFGWDCHGLPAEMEAEKELGVSGRLQIIEHGIQNFNEHCRSSVMKYADQWEWYVNRQARWVDFENDYKTMDRDFMESVIWAFSELNRKGLVYEGFKVMPYSWAAETVLSSSEIRLDDATREKEDKAVTVAFKLKERPAGAPEADAYYVLAWTTTPWTLPSNLALAASINLHYHGYIIDRKFYICAAGAPIDSELNKLASVKGEEGKTETIAFHVNSLLGLSYEPLFPYFASTENAFRILDGSSFIEAGSGTGIVHMAPGFGEDDQRICAENGIETIVPVDGEGRYTDAIYDLPAVSIRHPADGKAVAQDLGDSVPSLRDSQNDKAAKSQRKLLAQSTDSDRVSGCALAQSEPEKASGDLVDKIIDTKRCILRRPTPEDEQLFIDLHTNEKVMDTMNDGVLSVDEAKADFAKNLKHFEEYGYGQWVAIHKDTGAFMGRAGLSFVAQSEEEVAMPTIRCALLPDFWHDGYGSELCHASMVYAFHEQNYDEIAAGAVPHNPRAKAMLLRLGMRHVKDVKFKRMVGPYFRMNKAEFEAKYGLSSCDSPRAKAQDPDSAPSLRDSQNDAVGLYLRGLNVIKESKGKHEDEPYTDAQLEKYGLANLRIIQWLKATGRLIKQEDYKHNYPHCWRTDQPIIYKAMSSWFVDVPKIRDRMVELNQRINWIPGHVKDGRFGKWIENAREWSISRSRFWGCPIPVWRAPSGKIKVFGSIAELEAASGQTITDLHRPYIDEVVITDGGEEYRRVEDVFDCWFESGSMPYAQVHYPFENKEWFETHFPADFIVEYEAQTRGWFYNMFVLSVALFDRIPFKNCICHGVVLDDSGRKLSKKLKNYMDPKILFDQYGSDALRWFMMSSAIMRGSELLLDPEGKFIHDAIRLYLKPIWNAYHFFTLYANADGIKASLLSSCGQPQAGAQDLGDSVQSAGADSQNDESLNLMDRYILAKCREMVVKVESALDAYDTPAATQAVTDFVEVLNNWYIRRNKERFWNDRQDADKQAAYNTLYTVLHILSRAVAPLLPMVSEVVYQGLHGLSSSSCDSLKAKAQDLDSVQSAGADSQNDAAGSVHLADWPDVSAVAEEVDLVADMDRVRDACNTLLSIRSAQNIRIRQPLSKATLYGSGASRLEPFTQLIADEINLKSVAFSDDLEAVAEQKLTIHFPVAGKRLGGKMKAVAAAAKSGDWKVENGQMIVGGEPMEAGEYTMQLVPKDNQAGAQALSSNDALVVLDLTITPELEAEGKARDLVRMIQQARKDWDLHVADRIELVIEVQGDAAFIQAHERYIAEQTLASHLALKSVEGMKYLSEPQTLDAQTTIRLGARVANQQAA